MYAVNDVTGDKLISKVSNETYRNNYDMIFNRNTQIDEEVKPVTKEKDEDPNT